MSETKEPEPKKKRRSKSLFWQLILILVVLALIWFSFGQNVLKKTGQSGLPLSFGGLELVSSIEGNDAMDQVNQMHGVSIDLVSTYIAEYGDATRQLTVWIGKAETDEDAAALLELMIKSIADGNHSFSNLKRLTISQGYTDFEVIQVDGPGGSQHFFYLSGENRYGIVWVAIDGVDVLPVIEQAVRTF